ncbi:MAG: hypothetical protein DI586_08765, partial [Micavibrio aeruginosavorus]
MSYSGSSIKRTQAPIHLKQQAQLESFLSLPGYGETLLSGAAGTGKSFLVQSVLQKKLKKKFLIQYKFTNKKSLDNSFLISILKQILVLFDISENIIKDSQIKVIEYFVDLNPEEIHLLLDLIHENKTSRNLHENFFLLIEKLIFGLKKEVIFFLDDIQWAPPLYYKLLNQISSKRLNQLKIISCSRIKTPSTNIFLSNLTRKETKSLILSLNKKNKRKIDSDEIFLLTKGNPFYLDFLLHHENIMKSASPSQKSVLNLKQLLSYEYSNISKNQKKLLQIISCLREAINIYDLQRLKNYTVSKKCILFLEKSGRILNSNDFISISHDILKEAIFSSIDPAEKIKYHFALGKLFSKKVSANYLDETVYHFMNANSWVELYRYSMKGASYAYSRFLSELAFSFIDNASIAAQKMNMLKHSRQIKISIMRGKIIFLLGLSDSGENDMRILEGALTKPTLSIEKREEILNLLSLYYWNNGKLPKALKIIDQFYDLSFGRLDKNLIFSLRRIGIFSDMGEFSKS